MKKSKYFVSQFFGMVTVLLLLIACSGCETQEPDQTASASAIPWNKPASWEGPGALGAMGFQGTH